MDEPGARTPAAELSMDLNTLRQFFLKEISPVHGPGEAAAMFKEVFLHYSGRIFRHPLETIELTDAFQASIRDITEKLATGMPLQYALGYANFHDKRYMVNPDVLIPRPETEELLLWILEDYQDAPPKRILDVGTGSGCLAISLAGAFPKAIVYALDVSQAALKVAQFNARSLLGSADKIKWLHMDYLMQFPEQSFDLIVSNPPYISYKNQHLVDPHVRMFEPETALFAPGEDALVFYRRMTKHMHLQEHCTLFAELHSGTSEEVSIIFKNISGIAEISLRSDFNGMMRMLRCIKKGN